MSTYKEDNAVLRARNEALGADNEVLIQKLRNREALMGQLRAENEVLRAVYQAAAHERGEGCSRLMLEALQMCDSYYHPVPTLEERLARVEELVDHLAIRN